MRIIISLGNIGLFLVGVAVISYSADRYQPPLVLNMVVSFCYGWWTAKNFPWAVVLPK